jgi:hypothetical protein
VALPSLAISPGQFHANESVTVTVTPTAGMDFSGIQSNWVAILPLNSGIADVQGLPQSNGDLRVDFTTSPGTGFGIYTLVVVGPDNLVMGSGIIRCVPGR